MSGAFEPIVSFANDARVTGRRQDAPWYLRVYRGVLLVSDRFIFVFYNVKPLVQRGADELWDNIKEDETYKHSSWLKAAAVTAFLLLFYWGFIIVYQFRGYMDDVYRPTRNCMIKNPGVSNFFLRFIGFTPEDENTAIGEDVTQDVCTAALLALETDPNDPELISNITSNPALSPFLPVDTPAATTSSGAVALSQFTQMLSDRVLRNVTEDRLYKCEERRRQSDVCVLLAAVNMAEEMLSDSTNATQDPSDAFFDSFSGEMVYIFDVYLRNLEWTVWIGFAVGSLFGCWTLLSVMGQYKRLSLAIRSGLFTDFEIERQYDLSGNKSQQMGFLKRVDSIISTHSFAKLIAQYPMSTSIFFSGMLISTAILQLLVFGGLVASVFSLVASMFDSEVISILSPLLWTLLAFFVTWLVNGPIATFVLGEGLLVSHFHVIHEILFFLFLLVFTSIHLVVGLFLAFFRMVWVLLSSLVTINRLDKNLFVMYKERDIGHKSFMALILMQHVFHVNRSGNMAERSMWADVLRQLEESAHNDTQRRGQISRHTSEPVELLEEITEEEIMEQGRTTASRGRDLRQSQTTVVRTFEAPRTGTL